VTLSAATVTAIRRVLAEAGSMTRTQLAASFGFHLRSSDLASVIALLVSLGEVRVERRGTFGRPHDVLLWLGEPVSPPPQQLPLPDAPAADDQAWASFTSSLATVEALVAVLHAAPPLTARLIACGYCGSICAVQRRPGVVEEPRDLARWMNVPYLEAGAEPVCPSCAAEDA
jgi:hypothetical protein